MEKERESFVATIKSVRNVGKWIEFWFEENLPTITEDPNSYNRSSKSYKYQDAVNKAGLFERVCNNGSIGLKMKWVKVGNNYEIDSVWDDDVVRFNSIREWLINHDIEFTEIDSPGGGKAVSVDISLLMEEGIFDEFHKFCYELNKGK